WYLDFIKREIEKLKEGRFTGNINFQVNWKEGSVANLNIGLNKSVRRIVKDN
ncbi:unnamed protein product, partial [marine sediment metagenome]